MNILDCVKEIIRDHNKCAYNYDDRKVCIFWSEIYESVVLMKEGTTRQIVLDNSVLDNHQWYLDKFFDDRH